MIKITVDDLKKKSQILNDSYIDLLKSLASFWNDTPEDKTPYSIWNRCGSIMQDLTIASHYVENAAFKINKLKEQ